MTKASNYDTVTIVPGASDELRFTGSPTREPTLAAGSSLTVKKLTTDNTFAKTINIAGSLTANASAIDGAGVEPFVMTGDGSFQMGRQDDIGSFHSWVNGQVAVKTIYLGGSAGGASARLEIESGFDRIGQVLGSFNIGYIGATDAAGQVQLKGGTTALDCREVYVSASGKIIALISTTWKNWAQDQETIAPFVIYNKGEVNVGEGVAYLLTKGRYTDEFGDTGVPKLVVQALATFNTSLSGTTYGAAYPGVKISKGTVEMYDGSSTFGSSDRDVLVENDSIVKMFGGGTWTHDSVAGQSFFYINAGGGNGKALKLEDNARLEFRDYNSSWYDPGSAIQAGSKLTVAGNMIQDNTAVIKARGTPSIWDKIQLTGNFTTMTIGGSAKLELALKAPAPNPMQMTIDWGDFITALQVSASSPPYDPLDISIDGGWGTGWSVESQLVGTDKVRLRFTR